ncbi:unnamed protein product [Phytophthora lilii]|uniref:Unnamed protein product n=1 Tax=Phytophthora lilii TaxID=2077276 RepID=A0A9W6XDT7_9STRA|nr:unnamed protein product [Phytophthora lilii]
MVYVSNVSRPINQRLVAKQYNVSIETLKKHLSPDYKADPKYRFYNGYHMKSHLYEGVEPYYFYNKLENVLSTQTSAFKINIALGYELISKTDPDDTRYFYPNLANSHVFNNPIAINSKADIQKKVISEIRSMELADKLNYPSSGYKLKAITASIWPKRVIRATFHFSKYKNTLSPIPPYHVAYLVIFTTFPHKRQYHPSSLMKQ